MKLSSLPLILGSLVFASVASALTYRGADISSVPQVEARGIRYSDNGSQQPFERIIVNHGANLARIRVWTAGDSNLNVALALAKRAKNVGMQILIDFHYSDTWADPGKQAIPNGWPTDLSGLNTKIWQYTKDTVTAFVAQGTTPDMVQIGNEIRDGLLWPVGRISQKGYSPASQLVHSGVNGARAASPNTKIVIHIDNGWDKSLVQNWYKGMIIQGAFTAADVDIMGFSFYPFYGTSATFSNLRSSLSNIISLYNKDVMVVETDFPAICSGVTLSEKISPSASGQSNWVSQITGVLAGLPGGHGKGVIYWEPGWIGNAGLGSSCADSLLVDGNGATRSSINMFSSSM